MAKKQLHFIEAERLFVVEGCTLEVISSELDVSSRTLQDWKTEGKWDDKRAEMRRITSNTGELATSIAGKILERIAKKLENDEQLIPTEIMFLREFIPSRNKIKTQEEVANTSKDKKSTGKLSAEAQALFNELIGL